MIYDIDRYVIIENGYMLNAFMNVFNKYYECLLHPDTI